LIVPTLKDWLVTDSATPPPFTPEPGEIEINRRQMRSLLSSQAAPESVEELTPLQIARAVQRSGNNPRQIYQLIKQGVPLMRLANATGMSPETVRGIYQRQESLRLQRQGLSFTEIGQKLGISEAEARMTFARGHVEHYGNRSGVKVRAQARPALPGRRVPAADLYQRD
jgi:DNA-binding CsgD family transcriptional regulator